MEQTKRRVATSWPAANSNIKLIVILIQLALVLANLSHIVESQTTSGLISSQQEASFMEPIVWDSRSLYHEASFAAPEVGGARHKRSAVQPPQANHKPPLAHDQFVDACQSKMEVLTPYYATNSKGKLRTIVNSELMQQAIQVETCLRPQSGGAIINNKSSKCNSQPDCGCEQKYKWHRLLVLDPKDSSGSRGLFMDWFLFPSSCVCRCMTTATVSRLLPLAPSQSPIRRQTAS